MADFIHLHTHSEFSLLDGLGKLDYLIEKAKSFGMDALAITDHGAMYGSFKFYMKAVTAGIKPIIGVETYVARRSRLDKEARIDTDPYHLILLAENETGYRNLMKIVSIAHLEGFYYKPRIDWETLQKFHEGVICLSACLQGQVAQLCLRDEIKEAEEVAKKYAELFGKDHYYLELQRHINIPETEEANKKIIAIAHKLGIPLVATNDIHYVNADDAEAQDILLCIQTQHTVLDAHRPLSMIRCPDFYMRSPDEMKELFADVPEAIENTVRIANMCNLTLSVGEWHLPKYPVPDDMDDKAYLRKLVEERLPGKYVTVTQEIRERIEYELDIINKRNYTPYFLIVQDFVNWAKTHGVAVGPGRGSAAGSVICFILNITGIDPFYFKLPFERFLNPYRPSAPDIDLDFADDKRDQVIAYVTEKFGKDKVAQIITFGTMEAKGAIRDGGRALGMPYAKTDRLSRMIPPGAQGNAMTLEKALAQSAELALAYQSEPETKRLIDVAKKLEGVARHSSVHAAGIVISDKPLTDHTPIQKESKGERIITQYDMYTVGEYGVGLLKMDFLGLRNLTILTQALRFISENQHIEIDLTHIPIDDKKTFHLLASGETTGIFQLESPGMRRYIKELEPTTIFDLMAMVALYRPGPIQVLPEFIKRKHDPSCITYPDPRLKDVLKQSYGIITYQDDVLLTSITLAGYSWGDADKLRKAVGKKIASEMKKQREKFIEGCVKNGMTQKKAEEIFDLIEPFAGYGFNKAHAACYAMIAYQTAYLKANYPVEYMTAVLTAESRANTGPARDDKISSIVAECKRMGIALLPPDINASEVEFSIEHNAIRFGLSAVKNVGTAAIDSVIVTRKSDGPFTSLTNLISRVELSKVNKKTLESLIRTGAFDAFGKRAAMLLILPEISEHMHQKKKAVDKGQTGLFDESDTQDIHVHDDHLPNVEEFSSRELLAYEKELLGLYLTAHPLSSYSKQLATMQSQKIGEITDEQIGSKMTIIGIIVEVKKIITKANNNEMAFVKIEDLTGSIEVVVFPKIYAQTISLWIPDKIVQISGKLDQKDDRKTVLAESAKDIQFTH